MVRLLAPPMYGAQLRALRRSRRRYESNILSTRPGPSSCRDEYSAPSNTCSPFTHTPCTPIGVAHHSRCRRPADRSSSAGPRSRPWPDRTARSRPSCRGSIEPRCGMRYLRAGSLGQAAHALLQREGAGLAHPVREKVKPEAGVAEVDEMRAGVRQRDHARRMLEQRRDACVVVLVELRHELRIERQVEHVVQRILSRAAAASTATDMPSCSTCDQSP